MRLGASHGADQANSQAGLEVGRTHMSTDKPTPRIVAAYRNGRQLWMSSPFCGAIHFHGPPAGHRVAHCPTGPDGDRGPDEGYVLREVGAKKPPPPSLDYAQRMPRRDQVIDFAERSHEHRNCEVFRNK